MRQTGARASGRRPSCQPHPETCSTTAGSWAITVTGTSRLPPEPLTMVEGWWSPSSTSTRSSSPYGSTKEMRLVSE